MIQVCEDKKFKRRDGETFKRGNFMENVIFDALLKEDVLCTHSNTESLCLPTLKPKQITITQKLNRTV